MFQDRNLPFVGQQADQEQEGKNTRVIEVGLAITSRRQRNAYMLRADVLYGRWPDLPTATFPEASLGSTVLTATFPEICAWGLS